MIRIKKSSYILRALDTLIFVKNNFLKKRVSKNMVLLFVENIPYQSSKILFSPWNHKNENSESQRKTYTKM